VTIRLENLIHGYENIAQDEAPVVDIVEWEIQPGEHILLRGVSGSGKTTLFNIMTGLLLPASGTVWYDKTSLYSLAEAARDRFRARNIGYIFQNHFLLNTMTAIENVEMPMAAARVIPSAKWKKRAEELLAKVGLEHRIHYYPDQLSSGQRMRVAVARSLANYPNIVFADEPTASLDDIASETVMDLIQATCREKNAILIVASHDPTLIHRFQKIVNLRNGQLSHSKVSAHDV